MTTPNIPEAVKMKCSKSVNLSSPKVKGSELYQIIKQAQTIDTFKVCGLDLTREECNWILKLGNDDAPLFSSRISEGYLGYCHRNECPYTPDKMPYNSHEHWYINRYYVVETPEGVTSISLLMDAVKAALKAKIYYVRVLDNIVPIDMLKELASIWRDFDMELTKVNKSLRVTTDNGHNISHLYTVKEGAISHHVNGGNGNQTKYGAYPWTMAELIIDANKIKEEVKSMPKVKTTPESPQNQATAPQEPKAEPVRKYEPFDPVKMDATAKQFEVELKAILSDGNRATDVCKLVAAHYTKAGHKRIGRVMVAVAKGK